jgi:hypothetical protein
LTKIFTPAFLQYPRVYQLAGDFALEDSQMEFLTHQMFFYRKTTDIAMFY